MSGASSPTLRPLGHTSETTPTSVVIIPMPCEDALDNVGPYYFVIEDA